MTSDNLSLPGDGQRTVRNCKAHGDYYAVLMPSFFGEGVYSRCPVCQEETEQVRLEAAAQQERLRLAELYREAGIPRRYAAASFDNFRVTHGGQKMALDHARALVAAVREDPHTAPNMVFAGGPGTGKTHLSCAIVHELAPHCLVRRRSFMELLRTLRDTWRRDSERTEAEVIRFYSQLSLLVIEEIGMGYGTDAERAQIFSILDARYENQLPTLLITNLTLAELGREIGARVVDRMRDGERVCVPFDWQSQRGAA